MKELTAAQIEKAVSGRIICGQKDEKIRRVVTDSRQAASGDLFIPIIGERFDAHGS